MRCMGSDAWMAEDSGLADGLAFTFGIALGVRRASITEAGATGVQDLGKVMKLVMPKVSGRSDGKRVNELVRALLGG